MTTPKSRPSLARKDTRKTKAARDEVLEQGARVTFDGTEWFEVRLGDVTPDIARELRSHLGIGFLKLMDTMGEDPDVDIISAFVWVARRVAGETVSFHEVSVSYADIMQDGFNILEPDTEGDDPAADPEG